MNTPILNAFERDLIQSAFAKYFGLQSCLKSAGTQSYAIETLAEKTGLRKKIIIDNLEEITKL